MIVRAAQFSAFPPDRPAARHLLKPDFVYRVGRGDDADLRVDHVSVSRSHAELRADADGWHVQDVGSKNGVRVDGFKVPEVVLSRTSWFMVGDVHCSLELLDAHAAAARRAAEHTQRETSRLLSERLDYKLGINKLLAKTLDIVLELSGMERGFVLYAEKDRALRVRARHDIGTDEIARGSFAGSVAAVDRALASGASVTCCDTDESPWLGVRPSVRLGGIRALLCVPLRLPELCGAIYVDSRQPGPALTELDLELIENVAQHASAALDLARVDDGWQHQPDEIARIPSAPLWDDLQRPALAASHRLPY